MYECCQHVICLHRQMAAMTSRIALSQLPLTKPLCFCNGSSCVADGVHSMGVGLLLSSSPAFLNSSFSSLCSGYTRKTHQAVEVSTPPCKERGAGACGEALRAPTLEHLQKIQQAKQPYGKMRPTPVSFSPRSFDRTASTCSADRRKPHSRDLSLKSLITRLCRIQRQLQVWLGLSKSQCYSRYAKSIGHSRLQQNIPSWWMTTLPKMDRGKAKAYVH